jgi:hypothetical protein
LTNDYTRACKDTFSSLLKFQSIILRFSVPQTYREYSHSQSKSSLNHNQNNVDSGKNERSESGFDSITDGIFTGNTSKQFIRLNIPLPPTREPPRPPIENDFSPQHSPIPCRKHHTQPIPNINFIESSPTHTPLGNHEDDDDFNIRALRLIESSGEKEIKIDELNDRLTDRNERKGGFISEKIKHEDLEDLEIKVYPKDRM